jgi:hypothetical protein
MEESSAFHYEVDFVVDGQKAIEVKGHPEGVGGRHERPAGPFGGDEDRPVR